MCVKRSLSQIDNWEATVFCELYGTAVLCILSRSSAVVRTNGQSAVGVSKFCSGMMLVKKCSSQMNAGEYTGEKRTYEGARGTGYASEQSERTGVVLERGIKFVEFGGVFRRHRLARSGSGSQWCPP